MNSNRISNSLGKAHEPVPEEAAIDVYDFCFINLFFFKRGHIAKVCSAF